MPEANANLLTRDDTLLGVCQALGDDFGFNPLWLRIALAVSLLWNPAVVVGAYLAAGLLVAVSRFAFPSRPRTASAASAAPETAPVDAAEEAHDEPFAQAA